MVAGGLLLVFFGTLSLMNVSCGNLVKEVQCHDKVIDHGVETFQLAKDVDLLFGGQMWIISFRILVVKRSSQSGIARHILVADIRSCYKRRWILTIRSVS